ncbi:MAG TPA: bifunctional phosphoribosyl-AMP cyclohydrolase/phosphoribosyl-ATP diphosphatase HisIE [Polyangiaceae bacterium]|nr:bifunctional phosphoribosyl-AMP cyclohydrolase/phosphoribosyl-ATP diphosphatase HisIE [Polyangiaceae bacterium]
MKSLDLKLDAAGLIVAVAQDRLSGRIQMVAWMNSEALQRTLESGFATFFSRSRGALWQKGETSGHVLKVSEVFLDCDADTLVLLCDPHGPSCHTGQPTCFFRRVTSDGTVSDEATLAQPFLNALEATLRARASSTATKSYTRSLIESGAAGIGAKVREEAGEFSQALHDESDERVANEAADVLYHLLVGLQLRGLSLQQVIEVLAQRSGVSGHQEKASRQK